MAKNITLIEIDSNVQGESTTSLSIGTGTKVFTLSSQQPFIKGMSVVARYDASNTMTGTVLKVSGTTLTLSIASVTGSGTYAVWEINGDRTLYLSTQTYVSKSTDTPANQPYIGDISDPGNIEQYMFSVDTSLGESRFAKGNIVLNNKNGEWDFIRQLGFASKSVRIKQIESVSSNLPSTNVFTGTVIYPEVGLDFVDFSISDRIADLNVPAQVEVFLGTNSGSTGIEGSANGIKGQVKPFAYGGDIFNVKPKLLNESSRIYGVNFDYDGTTSAITTLADQNVLDEGLAKTLDTAVGTSGNVANLAALQAATIAAGKFAVCLSEGLFRLAGAPNGVVTCNFTQSSMTGAAIVKALIERIGFTSSDYVNSTFTSVDSDNSSNQEVYSESGENVLLLASDIMNGMGGYLISDVDNKFRVGLLKNPSSGSSVKTFNDYIAIDVSTRKSKDKGNGLPPKLVKILYKKNYSPLSDSEFAGAVTDTNRLLLGSEWKESVGSINQKIERKHPTAPIFSIESHFINETNANTERARQETLRQVERDIYSFSTYDLEPISLGDIITLQITGRFDISSGKKFVVIGKEIDLNNSKITYLVWG